MDNEMPLILLVEDHYDNRSMLKFWLESWNYHVIEASNGEEGFSRFQSARPDLILMDIKMPKRDGLETTQRIRQSAAGRHTPIILLSAAHEKIYLAAAKSVGADEYLAKPLDFERLEAHLRRYAPGAGGRV